MLKFLLLLQAQVMSDRLAVTNFKQPSKPTGDMTRDVLCVGIETSSLAVRLLTAPAHAWTWANSLVSSNYGRRMIRRNLSALLRKYRLLSLHPARYHGFQQTSCGTCTSPAFIAFCLIQHPRAIEPIL